MVEIEFNAEEHQGEDNFEPLPKGWYRVYVSASEKKETNAGDGAYIKLELTVDDGDYQGRRVWHNLNLWNKNQVAVDIAARQLSQLVRACGMVAVEDTEQLHSIPVMAKIAISPAKGDYDASNDVKGYKPCEEEAKPKRATKAKKSEPKETVKAASDNRKPWQK